MGTVIESEDFEASELKEIEKSLTFIFRNHFGADKILRCFLKKRNVDGTFSLAVPYAYGRKITKDYNIPKIKSEREKWNFVGTLKPEQQEAKNEFYPILSTKGSFSLYFATAYGKTITSIESCADLVGKSGGRVLVLFNMRVLIKQWIESILQFTNATVMIVNKDDFGKHPRVKLYSPGENPAGSNSQGNSPDGSNSQGNSPEGHFCCCMVQSLHKITFTPDVLVLDEAHRLCSQINVDKILKIFPKYLINLTATPKRPDGFESFLTVLAGGKKQQLVKISQKPFIMYPIINDTTYKDEGLTRLQLEQLISNDTNRNAEIVNLIEEIINKTKFKIMLMGFYVDQLTDIHDTLECKQINVARLIANDKKCENARIIIGNITKLGTGYDESKTVINFDNIKADLLIFILSTYQCEQPLGRVLRADKPRAIQIIDNHRWFDKTWKANSKFYKTVKGVIAERSDWKNIIEKLVEDSKNIHEESL